MRKNIYFVRHGESDANRTRLRQGPDSVLTDEGIRQAEFVGHRFKHIDLDVMIASPYVRTRQTSEIIQKHVGKPLEYSELFRERKNPSEIIGLHVDDPFGTEVTNTLFNNYHIPGARYSDEETFEDLKERAEKAVAFLEMRAEENILVISHGLFMRVFLARIIFGESLTSQEFVKIVYSHGTKNTGITFYEYDPERIGLENKGWLLKTWNDHAHLG